MTHWRRPCCEEDECLMMKPRAWCAAFKASVEFSFSLSPLWPEHLYVFSDVFRLQDCVLKQTSASLLKRWSERSWSSFVESLRGAFTDRCPVFTCQLYLFTYFKSASSSTWCLCLNMQDHVTGWKRKAFNQVSLVKRTAGETSKKVLVCGFPQTPHFTVLGAFNGS